MNLFNNIIFWLCLTVPSYAMSMELDLASGVNITVLNGEVVENNDALFVEGQNQLVIEFDGRLKDGSKREYFSAKPYLVTVNLTDITNLEIKLISNKLSKIESTQSLNKPMFVLEHNGESLNNEQFILPPGRNAFPYTDVPSLVKQYNADNGLVFDSGKIRSLKEELAAVQTGAVVGSTVAADSTVQESENTLQLKLWYSRATEEERKAFQKWLIDQK